MSNYISNLKKETVALTARINTLSDMVKDLESDNDYLQLELEKLREGIKGALRIEKLWIPKIVGEEHKGEAEALHLMRDTFINLLKGGE